MIFGIPWSERSSTAQREWESDKLLAEVRRIADKLVDDLQQAEKLTRHWSDGGLTDVSVNAALWRCLGQLAATGCWGPANRLPSNELWRIAGSLLEVGSLQRHARLKPRGYAGDHEMLARICEGSCCADPLGSAFDRYFLAQAAPQAVKSRTNQTALALAFDRLRRAGAEYHVASVGSGPALDVYEAVQRLPDRYRKGFHVALLDLDPDALDSAGQRLECLLRPEAVRRVRTNLFRLPQMPDTGALVGSPDFLICSGLFDYLDDEPAVSMLRLFWQQLGEDGLLLVGNFAPHNPTRAYMEWIGNWYLKYRSAAQLQELAARAEIPAGQCMVGCERLGVDLFLIGWKRDHLDTPGQSVC